MKKKNSILAIAIAFSMLFTIFPCIVSAGEFAATITSSAAVTNSAEQQVKRIAILPNKGSMVDVNVFGTAPGTFQLYNHKDTALDLPLSRNEGEDYPLWLGRVENMVGDVQRLDKVRYVTVRNNTVDKFGTYNFTLSTHIAGRVGMGK